MSEIEDFAQYHQPVGTIFSTQEQIKEASKNPEPFKLSAVKVTEFWDRGFISGIPLLSEQQCDVLLADYQRIIELNDDAPEHELLYEFHRNQSDDPQNVLFHCLGHWRVTEAFHDLPFHANITVPSSQLLHWEKVSGVQWWHDQLFAKPARLGGSVAWHQDYSYWTRTQPMAHLTVHIALDDQTLENGVLHYIPGSHRWTRDGGKPLPVTDFNFKDMNSIKEVLNKTELAQFKPEPAFMKKGEASFHHPLAVHGSFGNKSDTKRRAAVLNYFAVGTRSASDGDLIGGAHVKTGEKMNGSLFPVVYEPMRI